MNKLLSLVLCSLLSPLVFAEDCAKLEEKAGQKEVQMIPRWGMKVIAPITCLFSFFTK